MVTSSNGYRAHEGAAMPAPDPLERIRTAAAAAATTMPSTSSSGGMDAGRTAAAATDEAVEALKMEIREVKTAIWEGKLKLAAAAEAEERQWLRQEQRWLWDETRLMREEVKLRLEWRNGLVLQQQQQQLAGCGRFVEPPPMGGGCGGAAAAAAAGGANGAGWKMPASGWMFPEFMPGWLPPPLPSPQDGHRQQQQLRREPEMGVDMSGWIVPQQQPQLQQQQQIPQQQQQQQQERQRSRLPPLRPRKDPSGVASLPEAKTDPVPMQPPKNNNKKRKNSAVKEEQEAFVGREERGKRPRWKDHWVMHLIQVRGGMQDEFNKPPKQGVDLWRQVYSKLVASCPDFDKEPEACRKKWKMIVTDYKASNNHEGNERPEKCRWYQMMDEYINLRDIQTSVTDGGDSNAGAIVGLEEMDESRKEDIQSKITGLV